MNRSSIVLPFALLAMIGCSGKPDASSSAAPETTATSQTDSAATTFVSLKVPNMVWSACAASVRGDLSKIASVSDIQTDVPSKTCSFKISDPNVDYKAELAKLAETNSHLAEYSIQ